MNLHDQLQINGYITPKPKNNNKQPPVVVPVTPAPKRVLPPIRIAIVNRSTYVSDRLVKQAMNAIQIQVSRDFLPAWAIDATFWFYDNDQPIPPDFWQIVLFDTSDVAGALGYHDLTPSGKPLGKVFVKTAMTYGYSWTVTLSHEVVEMLVDPYVNLTVFDQSSNTGGRLYAYETADPVEDDDLGYRINGVLVSDFVFPAWFDGWRPANSTRFSQMNNVHAPFTLAKGGYASYFDVTTGTGWQQSFAMTDPGFKVSAMEEYAPRMTLRFLDTVEKKLSTNT